MHTIRKFNRFELKYLLTLQQAERFKSVLSRYLSPDEYGDSRGQYTLSSLYYDSPDYRCYWEKVDGIRFRRKLRIRQYETGAALTADTPVFVEIKQRVDRATQKRRALLPYWQALQLCDQRQMPEQVAPENQAFLEEVYAYLWRYNLRPAGIVRYQRQAFIGTTYDIGLRVTFDTFLTGQTNPLRLEAPPSELSLLNPNLTIMEIKVNERIPIWLTALIAAQNMQLIRISKYCRSIEVLGLGTNRPATFSIPIAINY